MEMIMDESSTDTTPPTYGARVYLDPEIHKTVNRAYLRFRLESNSKFSKMAFLSMLTGIALDHPEEILDGISRLNAA